MPTPIYSAWYARDFRENPPLAHGWADSLGNWSYPDRGAGRIGQDIDIGNGAPITIALCDLDDYIVCTRLGSGDQFYGGLVYAAPKRAEFTPHSVSYAQTNGVRGFLYDPLQVPDPELVTTNYIDDAASANRNPVVVKISGNKALVAHSLNTGRVHLSVCEPSVQTKQVHLDSPWGQITRPLAIGIDNDMRARVVFGRADMTAAWLSEPVSIAGIEAGTATLSFGEAVAVDPETPTMCALAIIANAMGSQMIKAVGTVNAANLAEESLSSGGSFQALALYSAPDSYILHAPIPLEVGGEQPPVSVGDGFTTPAVEQCEVSFSVGATASVTRSAGTPAWIPEPVLGSIWPQDGFWSRNRTTWIGADVPTIPATPDVFWQQKLRTRETP